MNHRFQVVGAPRFMRQRDPNAVVRLRPKADLTHEDAKEWYSAFGWHIPTRHHGDVELQAVSYEMAKTQKTATLALEHQYPRLRREELSAISDKAVTIRDAAEDIERDLQSAVTAYRRKNLKAVVARLEDAAATETEYGGASPASISLASQLLQQVEAGLAVFDGRTYLGIAEDEDEAREIFNLYRADEIVADRKPRKAEIGKIKIVPKKGPNQLPDLNLYSIVNPLD